MTYSLVYQESTGKQRTIAHIAPNASGTVSKQKLRLQPPGLTLVAMVPHEQRLPLLGAIEALCKVGRVFRPIDQLHFTVLGLFDERKPAPSGLSHNDLAAVISDFFRLRQLDALAVEIDVIRPGLFVGNPGKSDGTVVAMASPQSASKLLSVSKELADHLSAVRPIQFPQSVQRPMAGVWCTLGYFDEPDFDVDADLHAVLSPYAKVSHKLSVQTLSLTEFTFKTLADCLTRGLIAI